MTKCNKNEAKIKSTAYNQTGENLFEQISAYNSMSSHLRRVLQAKSVVDAKNKPYISKRREMCKSADCKLQFLKGGLTNDVIDRLAYDTLRRPVDIMKMIDEPKYPCERKDQKYFINCYVDYDVNCQKMQDDRISYEESNIVNFRNRSSSRSNKSALPLVSNGRKLKSLDATKNQNHSSRRFEENFARSVSATNFFSHQLSVLSNSSQSYDDSESDRKREIAVSPASTYFKDEEAKYADFVYEITREIMDYGLYTDEELQEVFKKHLERNKGILNMSKMLYEIYQLKIALNVSDDSDADDELEDLIYTQQLLSVTEVRPPTPPKVLDENKVIEKLMSYQQITDNRRRSSASGKSVILIDANPELVVTERDILMSLVEANIEPQHAQQICKSLFHKSKDTSFASKTQVEPENDDDTATENGEAESNHKLLDDFSQTDKRDQSSTIDDLILTEEKDVQAQENK